MKIEPTFKYAETDEWAGVSGKIATLGVSDFAQDQLSDIVFAEVIVSVGDEIDKGDQIATLESVKAAADVNSPLSGKVVEINEDLSSSPEMINSDPFGKAWIVKIEVTNPAELTTLMDAAAYEKYCEGRSH